MAALDIEAKTGRKRQKLASGGENSRRLVISRADVNTVETIVRADIAIAPTPSQGEASNFSVASVSKRIHARLTRRNMKADRLLCAFSVLNSATRGRQNENSRPGRVPRYCPVWSHLTLSLPLTDRHPLNERRDRCRRHRGDTEGACIRTPSRYASGRFLLPFAFVIPDTSR